LRCYVLEAMADRAWFRAITGVVIVFVVTDAHGPVVTFAVLLSFLIAGSALLRHGDHLPCAIFDASGTAMS
jgi:hypothetical protein